MASRARAAAQALLAAASALCAGCAYVHVDVDGSRRVVGLMALDIPAPGTRTGGETLRMRTLGVAVALSAPAREFAIGYVDTSHTLINDDSCIALHPRTERPK